MDFAGLIGKFRVNRPLTERERTLQLKQKQRLDVVPHDQLSVIELNSTYLESVDKWYGEKGVITLVSLSIITIFMTALGAMLHIAMTREPQSTVGGDDVGILATVAIMTSPILVAAVWLLLKESFAYTHYPIQFNRITRMVHVFRTNGTVLSVPWDTVFFTPVQVDQGYKFWNVLGHVLADDNTTIKESFALSVTSDGSPDGIAVLQSHWEFVRRYMEEGPAAVNEDVQFCMPLNKRHETLHIAIRRLFVGSNGGRRISNPLQLFSLLFSALVLPFRLIAMHTSKLPRWPTEVEQGATIATDDPYAIFGSPTGDRMAMFPAAAAQDNTMRGTGTVDNPLANAAATRVNIPASVAARGRNKRR